MGATLRRRVAIAGVLLAAAACKTSSRDQIKVTPSVSYWLPKVTGDVEITAGSQPGTSTPINLDDDLGISDGDQWSGRLDVEFGKNRVGLEYLPIHFHGDSTVGPPFIFHGATYPTGDGTSTDFDLTTYVLRWDYALWEGKKTDDAFRIGLGAWWWNFDMQVKGEPSGNNERRSFSHVYPGAHAASTFDLQHGLLADLQGAIAGTALDRLVYDLGAAVAYKLSDATKLSVGYRWMRWDFNESTNDGDFNLRGPYAQFTLRF